MKIVAENLGKRFNREWVFRNFNYQFTAGKTYAITGPNGSGKSTLMQVLWGQMHPSTGFVNFEHPSPGELFQFVAIAAPYMELIEEFTLEEMIRFHFKFKKCRIPLEAVAERIGLKASGSKTISSFSSGMKQRAKLALAFYSDVALLFLDEPCTNLDKKSIQWYHDQLASVPSEASVFIASNQEAEYPLSATKIDILS